jgi:transcription initiation factor TFIIIB Brf1 subunit/transcription initiation factor TFIIB
MQQRKTVVDKTYEILQKELNNENEIENAISVIKHVDEYEYGNLCGPQPRSLAASSVYIASMVASGEKKHQEDIADNFNVSKVTIRRVYQFLLEETHSLKELESCMT